MGKLFVIPWERQATQLDAWCYRSCGKAIVGLVDVDVGGRHAPFAACRHEDCPHRDADMAEAVGEINGDTVHPRRLFPLKAGADK